MRQESKNRQDPTVSPPLWRLILPALLILAAVCIWWFTRAEPTTSAPDPAPPHAAAPQEPVAPAPVPSATSSKPAGPEYVGRQACASCHAEQTEEYEQQYHTGKFYK